MHFKDLLLPLLLLFVLAPIQAQDDSNYNLLWKIEKAGQPGASYLFGTMHVRDERAFQFSDSVMVSIEKCDQFALEVHPDTMMAAIYKEIFSPDTTNYFREYLSEKEYEEFIKQFEEENGFSFKELESKNPLRIQSLKEAKNSFGTERQTFVDMHLYGIARTLGKPAYGLESVQSQIKSIKMQVLAETRYKFPADTTFRKAFENEMAETYKEGNLEGLSDMIGNNILEDRHLIKRNEEMTRTIINLMQSGSLFAAIGAAHLIGDQSVIAMLRKQGYTLSQVPSSFTGIADQYKIDPSKMPWIPFQEENSGVLLAFPNHANDISRVVPAGEAGEDSIEIHMRLCTDLTNFTNYLYAYNDYPLGYFVENAELGFQRTEYEFETHSTLLSDPRPIVKQGVHGREYDILMKKKYLAKMQLFIRGNRVYKFLIQDLSDNRKEISDHRFFDNIRFLPYPAAELKQDSTLHPFLEVPIFEKGKLSIDSSYSYDSYFNNLLAVSTVNPHSGGCYQTNTYEIDSFFSTDHLDTFYHYFIEDIKGWNDSITFNQEILINNQKGRSIAVKIKNRQGFQRHQFWIEGNQLIMQSIYADSSELWSPTADAFFQSIRNKHPLPPADLYSNKVKAILKGLQSTDTLLYKRALGAMEYYNFKTADLSLLHQALKEHYPKDTLEDGPSAQLLENIGYLKDSTSISFLSQLYTNHPAVATLKEELLSTLIQLDATETFLPLFCQSPPKGLEYTYRLFRPFQDSLELAHQHFDDLMKTIDEENYRAQLLSLANEMVKSDHPDYKAKINQVYSQLTAYQDQDLKDYQVGLDSSENHYYHFPIIYQYLYFFRSYPNPKCHSFLEQLYQIDTTDYKRAQVVLAQISNQIPVDQAIIDNLLSGYYTYDVMKVYDQINRLEALPDSLTTLQGCAKQKLIDYLYSEDEYFEQHLLLDEYTHQDTAYMIFKLSYDSANDNQEEEEEQYFGMVGPFVNKKRPPLKSLKAYYFWVDTDQHSDWKKAVLDNFQNYQKFGY